MLILPHGNISLVFHTIFIFFLLILGYWKIGALIIYITLSVYPQWGPVLAVFFHLILVVGFSVCVCVRARARVCACIIIIIINVTVIVIIVLNKRK